MKKYKSPTSIFWTTCFHQQFHQYSNCQNKFFLNIDGIFHRLFIIFGWCINPVARVRRRGDRPPSRKNRNILFLANRGRDKEFLSLYVKIQTGSRHLVFRLLGNPNWSQRWGTETGCVKGRYQHPNYALPKVGCIVLMSDNI